MTNNVENARAIQKKQNRILLAVLGGFAVLVLVTMCSMGTPNKKPEIVSQNVTPIALNSAHVDDSQIWLQRAENTLQQEEKNTTDLKQQMQALEEQRKADQQSVKEQQQTLGMLLQKISQLESDLAKTKQAASLTVSPDALIKSGYALPPPLPTKGNEQVISKLSGMSAIKTDSLNLTKEKITVSTTDKNPDSYVPAGTFAKAVLLSGLDASVGVNSQGQPRPVLLRILDAGTLPNHRHSHLKTCLVTGAGYGDISSERAYIRLERMSCTDKRNQITDFPVYGYISGADGKAGIRGIPVWRENTLLQRSFISGLFSGLSRGVEDTFTNTSTSALGTTQSVEASNVLKVGMASGASNSLSKLADYNIKRAEQYQPVIQVSAGSLVDVVFHTGFYLDGRSTETVSSTTNTNAQDSLAAMTDSSTSGNTHETE